MTLPGETEAGSAGMQPSRGIAWRGSSRRCRERGGCLSRSSQKHIGSVDPYAFKIPAPTRGGILLTVQRYFSDCMNRNTV